MKKLIKLFGLITWIYLVTGCNHPPSAITTIDYQKAEDFIKESEKQWAESVASGDSTVIERILADDFTGVDPEGNLYNKQQMVHETRNSPKYFKSNHLNDVKI